MPCNAVVQQRARLTEDALLKALTPEVVSKVLKAKLSERGFEPKVLLGPGQWVRVTVDYGNVVRFNCETGEIVVAYPLSKRVSPEMVRDWLQPVARQVIALKVAKTINKMGGRVTKTEIKPQYTQLRAKVG